MDVTPTLGIPSASNLLNPGSISYGPYVEHKDLIADLPRHLYNALRPVIPDNARYPRITATAGTRLVVAYSADTLRTCSRLKKVYIQKGLLPLRGVAASAFRPLRKIPNCCLP